MALIANQVDGGWQARLHLGFRRYPARTVLADRLREGPLAVQRALYPEGDLCHVYLLHPPGGVAGGDLLDISARVGNDAAALVTTPGATKFYRSAGPRARQLQQLVLDHGTLEWLPQENILFPGADVELSTRVELNGTARFIGWEINCLGRPAIGERFDHGQARFHFSLLRDGQPLLHERLLINGARDLDRPAGLRSQPVFATLWASLDDEALPPGLQETLPRAPGLAVTLVDGLLVARYQGDSTERARHLFIELWHRLRPVVLKRDPCSPRIWNT